MATRHTTSRSVRAAALLAPALLAYAVLCGTTPAHAADSAAAADSHWLPWENNYRYVGCGNEQALAPWTERLHSLAGQLEQTPQITGPALWAHWQAVVSSCGRPYRGELLYWPWPAEQVRQVPVPGQPGRTRLQHDGETTPLRLKVNVLNWLEAGDDLNDMNKSELRIGVAHITRHIGGYPVLHDRVLLVTRPGREPYRAVSVETALKAYLKQADAHRLPNDTFAPQAREMLSRLDAATLQGPAYYLDDHTWPHKIVTSPQPNAEPLLTINLDYYDSALPPQAIQALAVDLMGMDIDLPTSDRRAVHGRHARHLLEAADWNRIATTVLGR